MRSRRALALAALAAGAGLAAAAPSASALSVTRESPVGDEPAVVEIADDENEVNDITVLIVDDQLVVRDPTAAQVRALTGCTGVLESLTVTCPLPATVRVNALGRDDRVTIGPGIDATVYGGEGDDTITGARIADGGPGVDTLTGTDGDDLLTGGPGADKLFGGAGNDVFPEGDELEADAFDGGPGIDTIDYTGRPTPIVADLGPTAQTVGAAGEGDTGTGLERVIGGRGNDRIRIGVASALSAKTPLATGNRGNDRLELYGAAEGLLQGGSGDDTLLGGKGADRLEGGTGRDTLDGRGGDDALFGGRAGDVLRGGAGDDRLEPGAGNDRVSGGAGNDRINARDTQRDRIDGGPGRDRATVDAIDRVRTVERVKRRR